MSERVFILFVHRASCLILRINLYNGVLSRALFDQTFLVKLVFSFFLAVVVIGGIYIATR